MIEYNIMAHPKREEFIPYLQERLGGVNVIWDKENNCLETRIRCLEDFKDAKHCITIQDDAILTENFTDKVKDFISSIDKEAVYNFYYKKGQPEEDLKKGMEKGYILSKRLYNEIAFSFPQSKLQELIDYCKMRYRQGHTKDWVIQDFVWRNKIPVYFSIPSYVDHRVIPSILRGSTSKHRTALYFK